MLAYGSDCQSIFVYYQTLNHYKVFNPLPKFQILELSNLKAFADDIINVTQALKFVLERIENIVGKANKRTMMVLYRSPEC